jgi:hypothetical protein
MGKHFSELNLPGNLDSFRTLVQHLTLWAGVCVMSWSKNWPNCMVIKVFAESALLDPVVSWALILLADGSSKPSAGRFLGRLVLPPAYCGSMMRLKGVPMRPKLGSLRLLQVPSWLLNLVRLSQLGVGNHGHFLLIALLVNPLRSLLSLKSSNALLFQCIF